ncbi:MAG: tetratricopeptide repeat protein [Chloroflexi bacterium]|nr:tetratricopeptide repeat protein [Chloroflexota bacterium]
MPTDSDNPFILQAIALIEQRLGLAVGAQFRVHLEAILFDFAQGNLAQLVQTLQNTPETAPAWQQLIHTLAIGETYFFRHQPYLQLLKNYILPDLVPQRRAARRLNIWSAGCATGEEPYSIAITLRESLADLPRWNIQLIGTDINQRALKAAQKGIYRPWAFRQAAPHFQERYFNRTPDGPQLKPEIRQMATFRQGNLLAAPPLPQFDIIVCCNVLIYFHEAAVRRVSALFYETLVPGGWLILGQAEMLRFERDRWATHVFPDLVVYQKPAANGAITYRHDQPLPQTAPRHQPPTPPAYADAVSALRQRRYDEAERLLSSILAQNPDFAPAHVLIGCIFANRQAHPEAFMHLDTALRLDPLEADAHCLRGLLHLENRRESDARESLRAALYCDRQHILAAMILGHLYSQIGQAEKARRTWEDALRALNRLAPDAPISDISDLTAETARAFLSDQLKQL